MLQTSLIVLVRSEVILHVAHLTATLSSAILKFLTQLSFGMLLAGASQVAHR